MSLRCCQSAGNQLQCRRSSQEPMTIPLSLYWSKDLLRFSLSFPADARLSNICYYLLLYSRHGGNNISDKKLNWCRSSQLGYNRVHYVRESSNMITSTCFHMYKLTPPSSRHGKSHRTRDLPAEQYQKNCETIRIFLSRID